MRATAAAAMTAWSRRQVAMPTSATEHDDRAYGPGAVAVQGCDLHRVQPCRCLQPLRDRPDHGAHLFQGEPAAEVGLLRPECGLVEEPEVARVARQLLPEGRRPRQHAHPTADREPRPAGTTSRRPRRPPAQHGADHNDCDRAGRIDEVRLGAVAGEEHHDRPPDEASAADRPAAHHQRGEGHKPAVTVPDGLHHRRDRRPKAHQSPGRHNQGCDAPDRPRHRQNRRDHTGRVEHQRPCGRADVGEQARGDGQDPVLEGAWIEHRLTPVGQVHLAHEWPVPTEHVEGPQRDQPVIARRRPAPRPEPREDGEQGCGGRECQHHVGDAPPGTRRRGTRSHPVVGMLCSRAISHQPRERRAQPGVTSVGTRPRVAAGRAEPGPRSRNLAFLAARPVD